MNKTTKKSQQAAGKKIKEIQSANRENRRIQKVAKKLENKKKREAKRRRRLEVAGKILNFVLDFISGRLRR